MKNKFKKIFALIFIIADLLIFFLLNSGTKLIYNYATDNFQTYVSNCSYFAVQDLIESGCDFSNVYNISKNANGDIEMISTNVLEVNKILKDLSTYCFEYMDDYMKAGIEIPIGVFSGINILANSGPKINIKFLANLSVCCQLQRTFSSAGINQTRHTLTAIISVDVYVYSIFQTKFYTCGIEVPLIDNVIVGKVPQNYFTAEIVGESVKKG